MSVRGIALAVVCLLSFTLDAGCNEASAETTKVHYGSRTLTDKFFDYRQEIEYTVTPVELRVSVPEVPSD